MLVRHVHGLRRGLHAVVARELAGRYDEHTFKRNYGQLKGPALKKPLVESGLASSDKAGAKGIKPPAQVELLWDRARLKAEEDGRQ